MPNAQPPSRSANTNSLSSRERWLAVVYAATIFVGAFLLFQVQPLVTKHILPWFGGSPAVWTVCMLFFQSVLLAGYLYSHLSQRLRLAQQVAAQLAIIVAAVAAVAALSILPGDSWQPREGEDPVRRILITLAVSVGLPFFVLATTAPLIQAWFARSFPGRVPYRLYALSNLGSLLALLSYPFVFERVLSVPHQAQLWSCGFAAYAVLCAMAGVRVWRSGAKPLAGDGHAEHNVVGTAESRPDSPTWLQRFLWLVLPAMSVVALLATTNHVCADVATVPLLWVVPLALYLLTYIIAFDHSRWYRRTALAALTLAAIYGAALTSRTSYGWVELYNFGTTGRVLKMVAEMLPAGTVTGDPLLPPELQSPRIHVGFLAFLVLNLAAMFGFCMLCHGELFRQRPHPKFLTAYYLMMAAGGVVGGVAVTLIAPQVFNTYFEWQLFMFGGAIWAIALLLHRLIQTAFPSESAARSARRFGTVSLVALVVLLLPASLVLLDLVEYLQIPNTGIQMRQRNFFGTLAVRQKDDDDNPNLSAMFLYNGIIAHGSQFIEPSRRAQPTSYYSTVSGIGRTLNFFRKQTEPGGMRAGVVGLGTGTVAAYIGGGDSVTFYEINPAVIELTESGRWFTYLKDCRDRGGKYEIKLGDARLVLEREVDSADEPRFHVLAIDAFSGDAIPIHLLTQEAFDSYLKRLTSSADDGVDGALVVHISNRYLDLEPIVRAAAEKFDIPVANIHTPRDPDQGMYEAEWMVLTRNPQLLEALATFAVPADEPAKPAILWTDDRSNLFDVVK